MVYHTNQFEENQDNDTDDMDDSSPEIDLDPYGDDSSEDEGNASTSHGENSISHYFNGFVFCL